MTLTPQQIANTSAEAMWRDDEACKGLGMVVQSVGPGTATLTMKVTADMTNGHGTCHGGFIFTLADSAFAYACNSYNQRVVAGQAAITFIAPAFAADVLTAHATEVRLFGRSGIYDVRVTRQSGDVVAEFRGHSRTIKGTHFNEEE